MVLVVLLFNISFWGKFRITMALVPRLKLLCFTLSTRFRFVAREADNVLADAIISCVSPSLEATFFWGGGSLLWGGCYGCRRIIMIIIMVIICRW